MKKADRGLVTAMIACLLLGLAFIVQTLFLNMGLHVWNLWGKDVPPNASKWLIKANIIDACITFPGTGVAFLLAGYGIWNYRRKRGPIKVEADDGVAKSTT
jgi:hypothetical protein